MTSKIGTVNFSHLIEPNTLKIVYPRGESRDSGNVLVKLLNAFGDEVKVPIEVTSVSQDSIEISIQDRPTGIFYLKIQDGLSYIMKKIILQ